MWIGAPASDQASTTTRSGRRTSIRTPGSDRQPSSCTAVPRGLLSVGLMNTNSSPSPRRPAVLTTNIR